MLTNGQIDVTFDFRSDTRDWPRRDPDKYSATLRRYHQLLWSKPLPTGMPFVLDTITPRAYLHHSSELGEFWLASDAVIPTFKWLTKAPGSFLNQLPHAEFEAFYRLGYTIGGMMIWPGNKVDGQWTINQARGCDRSIRDRFDLTLECIRRQYLGEWSPLSGTLIRYGQFFSLFGDFRGFVDFFLLKDLVTEDYSAVRFSLPFHGFDTSPLPRDIDGYKEYMRLASEFLEARNRRIAELMNAPSTR